MWPVQLDNEIQVKGYVLEVESEDEFEVIWNGRNHPEITSYIFSSVQTGSSYNFRYKVINRNGESPYSEILSVWACEMPTVPQTPTWITSTETSITVQWSAPTDDGGCPVREYRVYRDDGHNGSVNNAVHVNELKGLYYKRELTVTELPLSSIGNRFRFRVAVFTDYAT